MIRHIFRNSIFIAATLAASAAFADVDVVTCVDLHGKVTLTDAQCDDAVRTVVAPAAAELAPPASANDEAVPVAVQAARRTASRRVAYAPQPVRLDSRSAPRAGKMLSRDVETLKAARLSMQVLDGASATARQQRLARLN